MRNTITNVGLLIIVLSLSAVFLLEFGGPQSQGCAGDIGSAKYAAKVNGETISIGEMKAAYILANGPRYDTQTARDLRLKELVLGGLIERDLLAAEAEQLGFRVSEDEVMIRLAADGILYVSAPVGAPSSIPSGPLPINFSDEKGEFNAENARRFIQNRLGRTVEEFAKSQIRETLAARMREVVGASVVVSPSEVWDAYAREKDKAEAKYVLFDPTYYRDRIDPKASELASYVTEHQAEVDAKYEQEKHRYTGLEKQVRARHILIKVEPDADDKTKAAGKAKAEAARARVLKGEDFATLARTLSEDTGSAVEGGDLGYNTKGRMVAPFDDAQFALKAGDVSEVVETRFGYHVIKVEGVREGDVPLDEAKQELARELYIKERSAALAKAAADKALAELKGGTSIDDLQKRLEREKEADGAERPSAPAVAESRPFGRGASPIPGVDNSKVVESAFALTTEKPLVEAPIQAGESWVVLQLTSREHPDREKFKGDEERRLSEALLRRKRNEVVDAYTFGLRKQAEQRGRVRINPEAVAYSRSEETASL